MNVAQQVLERLDALEAENRELRRGLDRPWARPPIVVAASALVSAIVAMLVVSVAKPGPSLAPRPSPTILEAEQVIIKDRGGIVRAKLGITDRFECGLTIFGDDGDARVSIFHLGAGNRLAGGAPSPELNGLTILTKDGQAVTIEAPGDSNPFLMLTDRKGVDRVQVSASGDRPGLTEGFTIWDSAGEELGHFPGPR